MRNLIVIALALFALGAVTCLAEAPAGKAASRPQWEYQALPREKLLEMGKTSLTAGLNKAGEDGWELVTVTVADFNTPWYYFKRAKAEATPKPTKAPAPAPEAAQPKLQLLRLRFATAGDLARTLHAVFGEQAPVIVPDPRTNALILRGSMKQIEEVNLLVRDLDVEGEHKKATP